MLAFVIKFNSLVQSIFFNTMYQVQYPAIINSSNIIPYAYDEQYWKPLSYDNKTVFKKKIKFYGDIDEYSFDIYSNLSIAFPKLLNYYICASNPLYTQFIGNSIYPLHHYWFDKRNYNINSYLIEDFELMDTVIAMPFSMEVTPLFYIMNIFSLLFSLNSTMIHKYPILLGKKFDYFDEIIDLVGLKNLYINIPNCTDDFSCSNIIYANEAFLVSVPNPNEVAYEPIQRMVDIMKPKIKENIENSKPIIISTGGDRRIIGKKALFEYINNTFDGKVENLVNENYTFTDLASRFINAKIAISFSSDEMSLIPFMKPGSIYIEIQDSRIVSHNVLLAQSFGLDVRIISISDFNVSKAVLKNVTRIIKKNL